MRHYQFTNITPLLLLLLPKSWSFSATPRFSALKSAVTDEVMVATNNVATDSNVLVFSPLCKKSSAWQSLIPLIPGERGCDVSIEWSVPQEGSRRLLQHLFPSSPVFVERLQPFLQESFENFQSLATSNHRRNFKARIVATRGPSGTKCPRWHVDHVPLRWIQSLVGPGCDYVLGCEGIDWMAMNELDSVEKDVNEKLVNEHVADIRHAPTQQGVVLWGAENNKGLTPAVHKSPSLSVFEGRVLLTLDVVRDE